MKSNSTGRKGASIAIIVIALMIFSVLPLSAISNNETNSPINNSSGASLNPADQNPVPAPKGTVTYMDGSTILYQETRYAGETVNVRFDIVPQNNNKIFLGWESDGDVPATYSTDVNSGDGYVTPGGTRSFVMEVGDITLRPVWVDPSMTYSSGNVSINLSTSGSYVKIANGVTSVNLTGSSPNTFYLLLDGVTMSGAPAIKIDTPTEVRIQFTGDNVFNVSNSATYNNYAVIETDSAGIAIFEGRADSSLNIYRNASNNNTAVRGAMIGSTYSDAWGATPQNSGIIQIESGTVGAFLIPPDAVSQSGGVHTTGAGIGGCEGTNGEVVINGGNVKVSLKSNFGDTGSVNRGISGAGIGGGARGAGTVAVTGGIVNVRMQLMDVGAMLASGIGGGGGVNLNNNGKADGADGYVTITGGSVDVRMHGRLSDQFKGAAIGGGGGYHPGGQDGDGGDAYVKITGGTVTAYRSNPRGGYDIGAALGGIETVVVDAGSVSVSSSGKPGVPNTMQTSIVNSQGAPMARYTLWIGDILSNDIMSVLLNINKSRYHDLNIADSHLENGTFYPAETDPLLYLYIPIYDTNDVSLEYDAGDVLYYENLHGITATGSGGDSSPNYPIKDGSGNNVKFHRVMYFLNGITHQPDIVHVQHDMDLDLTLTAQYAPSGNEGDTGVRFLPPQVYVAMYDAGGTPAGYYDKDHTWNRSGASGTLTVENITGRTVIVGSAIAGYNVKYVINGEEWKEGELETLVWGSVPPKFVYLGQNIVFNITAKDGNTIAVTWMTELERSGTLQGSGGQYTLLYSQFFSDVTISITTKPSVTVSSVILDNTMGGSGGAVYLGASVAALDSAFTFRADPQLTYRIYSVSWKYSTETEYRYVYNAAGNGVSYTDYRNDMTSGTLDPPAANLQDRANALYHGIYRDDVYNAAHPNNSFTIGDLTENAPAVRDTAIQIRIETVKVVSVMITTADGAQISIGEGLSDGEDVEPIYVEGEIFSLYGVQSTLHLNDVPSDGTIGGDPNAVYFTDSGNLGEQKTYNWTEWFEKCIPGMTDVPAVPGFENSQMLPRLPLTMTMAIDVSTKPIVLINYVEGDGIGVGVTYARAPGFIQKSSYGDGTDSFTFELQSQTGYDIYRNIEWNILNKDKTWVFSNGGNKLNKILDKTGDGDDYSGTYTLTDVLQDIPDFVMNDYADIYIEIYVYTKECYRAEYNDIEDGAEYSGINTHIHKDDCATVIGEDGSERLYFYFYISVERDLSDREIYRLSSVTWDDGRQPVQIDGEKMTSGPHNGEYRYAIPWDEIMGDIIVSVEITRIFYVTMDVVDESGTAIAPGSVYYPEIRTIPGLNEPVDIGNDLSFSVIPKANSAIFSIPYTITYPDGTSVLKDDISTSTNYHEINDIQGNIAITIVVWPTYSVDYGNVGDVGFIMDANAPSVIFRGDDLRFQATAKNGYAIEAVEWQYATDDGGNGWAQVGMDGSSYFVDGDDIHGNVTIRFTVASYLVLNLQNGEWPQGASVTNPIRALYGSPFPLPADIPVSNDHNLTFHHWSLNVSGGGTEYLPGGSVEKGANRTLYAIYLGVAVDVELYNGDVLYQTIPSHLGEYENLPDTVNDVRIHGWERTDGTVITDFVILVDQTTTIKLYVVWVPEFIGGIEVTEDVYLYTIATDTAIFYTSLEWRGMTVKASSVVMSLDNAVAAYYSESNGTLTVSLSNGTGHIVVGLTAEYVDQKGNITTVCWMFHIIVIPYMEVT